MQFNDNIIIICKELSKPSFSNTINTFSDSKTVTVLTPEFNIINTKTLFL